ncbi:MAG: ABC transporter substrate-binding protein [Gammaproteobacteria bacterium]|nr:ABC transporter substrate-binding protein [Gammaproteobacteria bacterium]
MLALQPVSPARANADSGSPDLGRQLFFEGRQDGRDPLTANVGAASVPVPATALPCAGCHGRDGQGRPEGGVRPSDITWFNLSREYGGVTAKGRRFQVYDEDRFLRAVSEGFDSSGNQLDSSMPRYNISRRDARDLIAYLKVIQDDFDPGVSDDAIVFATVQPTVSAQSRVGDAMVEVMRARFDEVNREGGVYGRQLRLEVLPFEDRQSFIGQASRVISGDAVFALVNVFSSTADLSLADMAEDAGIPSIAPYTQFPAAADGRHLYTFYLHGGLDAQIAALARRAAEQAGGAAAYVLYRAAGAYAGIADNARARFEQAGFAGARAVPYAGDGSERLSNLVGPAADAEPVVLFLGPSGELAGLLGKEALGQAPPRLYLPGFFVSADILGLPAIYARRLEMAYHTVLDSGEGGGLSEFRQFMSRHRLAYSHLNSRLYAYSAAEILIEGAKRAGKRLTRKKLVSAIEELYSFDAGLNRPVSFSSQRRTGLRGAYMVGLDLENKRLNPSGTWVGID